MSRPIAKFGCRNLMTAKSPVKQVIEPASRRFECEYRSNIWVASIPLCQEEEDSLKISQTDRILKISGALWSRTWEHEISIPYDAIRDTLNAKTGNGTLFISAELESTPLKGKEIPIFK